MNSLAFPSSGQTKAIKPASPPSWDSDLELVAFLDIEKRRGLADTALLILADMVQGYIADRGKPIPHNELFNKEGSDVDAVRAAKSDFALWGYTKAEPPDPKSGLSPGFKITKAGLKAVWEKPSRPVKNDRNCGSI